MNPPDPNPKDSPNPNRELPAGISSMDEANNETSKIQEGASSKAAQDDGQSAASPNKNGVTPVPKKAKPNDVLEEVRQAIRGKVREAVANLRPGFPPDVVAQAEKDLVDRLVREIVNAATNYLKNSAKACKIGKDDLLKEILRILGYKFPTKSPRKPGTKADSPNAPDRGSNRGKKGRPNGS